MVLFHRGFPITVGVNRTRWRPVQSVAGPHLLSGVLIHCLTLDLFLYPRRVRSFWAIGVRSVAVCPLRTVAVARAAAGPVSARSRELRSKYDDLIATFIAIIINSLDETKRGNLQEGLEPVSRQDLVRELRATQETLKRLEERLNADDAEEEDRR